MLESTISNQFRLFVCALSSFSLPFFIEDIKFNRRKHCEFDVFDIVSEAYIFYTVLVEIFVLYLVVENNFFYIVIVINVLEIDISQSTLINFYSY